MSNLLTSWSLDNSCVAEFSPDARRVLLQMSENYRNSRIEMREVHSGKLIRDFSFDNCCFAVKFSVDGRTVIASDSRNANTRLLNAATGELIRVFSGPMQDLALSPDGRTAVSATTNTLQFVSLGTGRELLRLHQNRQGEWLAQTPEGFFAGKLPKSDRNFVSIVRGLDVTSVGQVHQALYNPDLVREALAGDPNGEVKRAAEVINLDKVLDSGPAPAVELKSPMPFAKFDSDLATVEIGLTDRGKGVGRVEWRVNGVTVAVDAGLPKSAMPTAMKKELALDPGENEIEVVAYNATNLIASPPASVKITHTGQGSPAQSRLHVLAIGINDYIDQGSVTKRGDRVAFGRLDLAVKDADALAQSLKTAAGSLYTGGVNTVVLRDREATRKGISEAIDRLAREVGPRDTFVLFAAAHGTSSDGRYYLIPQDYDGGVDPRRLAERAVGQEMLQDWLANRIKAKKALILLDTCESGAVIAGHLLARGEGGASEAGIGRLHEATGRPVLTAAAAGQFAHEGVIGTTGTRHGVFTWALLDALQNGDANGNGTIELSELASHVQTIVPKLAAKYGGQGESRAAFRQGELGEQASRFGSRGEDFALVSRLRQ